MVKAKSGMGFDISATIGARIVDDLATTLQSPKMVPIYCVGNTLILAR
jgi:hypothetical protein